MSDPAAVCDAVLDSWLEMEDAEIEAHISSVLDELAELRAAIDAVKLQREARRDALLTDDQRKRLQAIDDELRPVLDELARQVSAREDTIRSAVSTYGKTVRGARLMAVYRPGRDLWDSKKLMRLAKNMPEIWSAHRVGNPGVSIVNIISADSRFAETEEYGTP